MKEIQLTYRRNANKNIRGADAVSMVGTMFVAAILLSGLLLIATYPSQLVLAQQENTMGNSGNGVTGRGGATNTTTIMLTTMDGGGGGAIVDGNATTVNMTEGLVAQGNDSMSLVRMHLEETRIALQNNDTQGALMNLDLALQALGSGNVSSVASGISTNVTTGTNVVAGDYIPVVVNGKPLLSASETSSANNDDEEEDAAEESDSNTEEEDSEGVREANDDEEEDAAEESDSNTDEEDSECGAVNIGGTSPADDYGCPPDDDGA